ncbi:MAG: 2-hydroxyglutaryl-CoA dehydratase [Oscillospiraceae bacterium]|nr:2-hydroxyglutaryl-CoA dehydratase [Oscillospiraceae bacterium]
MYTLGVDIGSATSKCIVLKNGEEIVGRGIANAGTGTSGPARAVKAALEDAQLTEGDIAFTVATGYGRNSYERADHRVSELSCHAIGASRQFEGVRTVIDIGGQDAKVMRLDKNGRLDNFLMNDKCAAGTGRFLDVMAHILELSVDELDERDRKAQKICSISSTCTVFAESEVISQLSQGADVNDIIAGIHASVAVRTASLARRLGVIEPVAMTGGVAQNGGVVRALERELGVAITTNALCQFNGSLGAAISAYKMISR